MPFYEFECNKCSIKYDELVLYDESGKYPTVKCPECGSSSKTKLISAVRHTFTNPEGTDKMNTHDYRYRHAIEKPGGAVDQRKMAEKLSHVGSSPYSKIDDISGGKHFGPVK
jgi:putative FmdB family regulatory protein